MSVLRRRSIMAGLIALVIGLPVGYALVGQATAESDGGGTADSESYFPTPEEWEKVAARGPVEDPPHDGGPEVDYYVEGPMAPAIVDECRQDPVAAGAGDPLLCDLIVAVSEGTVAPGAYSTAEVEGLDDAKEQK